MSKPTLKKVKINETSHKFLISKHKQFILVAKEIICDGETDWLDYVEYAILEFKDYQFVKDHGIREIHGSDWRWLREAFPQLKNEGLVDETYQSPSGVNWNFGNWYFNDGQEIVRFVSDIKQKVFVLDRFIEENQL